MPFSGLPYWRLSGFYLFYFATLGILVPYWGLYLQWEGFSARQIGELTAILLATRIIAPNVWGWIADHRGQRLQIVRLASLLSIVAFSGIFISQSYYWIAVVLMVLLLSISGIWLISLTVPESASRHLSLNHIPIKQVLKQPAVRAFLAICFLMLVSHGPYYTFYSIYLEQHGYSRTLIGQLWALGVVAELMVFLVMHRWLPRFGIRKVLLGSLLLAAFRWLLIALYADQVVMLIAAQSLHAASYGAFHAASIAWVHQHFTGRNQGRGQALYSSMSFGAGGAVGSLLSGYLWLTPGPEMTFMLAAVTAIGAFLIGFIWLKNSNSAMEKQPHY